MTRVRAALPDLHPTERRLAEAVLDLPGDVASYSASEIADLAGVSNATVSRFVRKLGYASFDEARKAVRDDGRSAAALMRFGTRPSDTTDPITAHHTQSLRNLDDTYANLDPAAIEALAVALHAARRVHIAGFRAGYPLASYLAWQVRQVVPDITLLPKPGETLAETAASIGAESVAVFVLVRRAPALAWKLAEMAIDSGAQVAIIGDMPSMHSVPARWHFGCATSSTAPLLNHVGAMAICNLIAARTVELSDAQARARMARIEDIHERMGEL